MLSRVADSLYWMSRYLERAEHTTRLLDVNLNLMLDESAESADRRWQRVLLALGNPKDIEWTGDPYALTHELTFDTSHKGSILSCIIAARENSRHVREQISTEQWHRLNSLYLEVTRPNLEFDSHAQALLSSSEQQTEFLQRVMEAVHQFQGVTDSTMSHGEGWQFIQVGRYIERASATAMLLEAYHKDLWAPHDHLPDKNEYLDWMGLLRSATAFEAYCKVYTADLTPERILEFLLLDERVPALAALLHRQPPERPRGHPARERQPAYRPTQPPRRPPPVLPQLQPASTTSSTRMSSPTSAASRPSAARSTTPSSRCTSTTPSRPLSPSRSLPTHCVERSVFSTRCSDAQVPTD